MSKELTKNQINKFVFKRRKKAIELLELKYNETITELKGITDEQLKLVRYVLFSN